MTVILPLTRSAIAAVLVPVILYTVWLVVSRRFVNPSGLLDWAALALSLAVGLPFVWRLPWINPRRGRAVVLYVALGTFALSLYTVVFEGIVYGRW